MGLAGLHRIYNKKYVTGILWFFTFGFFGIGQIIDLFLIPDMVDVHNLRIQKKLGLSAQNIPLTNSNAQVTQTFSSQQNQLQLNKNQSLSQEEMMIELARAAQKRNGKLSITQAVIDTGITFEKVEKTLNYMHKKNYVSIENHSESGAVIYDFLELL